MTNGRWFASA